jgi:L-alanine-DL-glutamate epimerase-like enolase superfamily enzyme
MQRLRLYGLCACLSAVNVAAVDPIGVSLYSVVGLLFGASKAVRVKTYYSSLRYCHIFKFLYFCVFVFHIFGGEEGSGGAGRRVRGH